MSVSGQCDSVIFQDDMNYIICTAYFEDNFVLHIYFRTFECYINVRTVKCHCIFQDNFNYNVCIFQESFNYLYFRTVLTRSQVKIDTILTYCRGCMNDNALQEYMPFFKVSWSKTYCRHNCLSFSCM